MWVTKRINIKTILMFLVILGFSFLLFFFSNELGQGVRQGLSLCGELVIPALFVFLCFCEWACLSHSIQNVANVLQPLFRLLFGKEFSCGAPFLLCLIGGYPMGASALAIMRKNNLISNTCAKQHALWIFCPSPSFVIVGVGQGMLGSFRVGLILWGSCVISCLLTGCVFSRFFIEKKTEPFLGVNANTDFFACFPTAIGSATEKMLVICATVVLFAGVLSVVSVLPLPAVFRSCLQLFTEVTNGCNVLVEKGGSLAEIGAILMFGGIATHLQCQMLLGKEAPPYNIYCFVRISQAVLCYGIISLFGVFLPNAVQTFSVGNVPTANGLSVLPSVWLLGTCCVFLCSIYQMPIYRRNYREKPRIYS